MKLEKFASGKTIKPLLVSTIGCRDETPWSQKKGISEIEEQNFEDESQPQSIKCGSRILLSGSTLSLKMLYGSSTMIFSRSFRHLILEVNDCLKGEDLIRAFIVIKNNSDSVFRMIFAPFV